MFPWQSQFRLARGPSTGRCRNQVDTSTHMYLTPKYRYPCRFRYSRLVKAFAQINVDDSLLRPTIYSSNKPVLLFATPDTHTQAVNGWINHRGNQYRYRLPLYWPSRKRYTGLPTYSQRRNASAPFGYVWADALHPVLPSTLIRNHSLSHLASSLHSAARCLTSQPRCLVLDATTGNLLSPSICPQRRNAEAACQLAVPASRLRPRLSRV